MQEAYSGIYADLWRRHWWWRVRHELVMRTVAQLWPGDGTLAQPRRIFDIGCAGGVSFDDLSRYGTVDRTRTRPDAGGCVSAVARAHRTERVRARLHTVAAVRSGADAGCPRTPRERRRRAAQPLAPPQAWRLRDHHRPGPAVAVERARRDQPALPPLRQNGLQRLLVDSGFAVRDLRYFFRWPLGLMYLRKLLLGTEQRPGKSYTVTVPPTR